MKLPIHLHPSLAIRIEILRQYKLGGLLGFLFETTMTATKMVFDGVFEKFPDIVLILSHFGATIPFLFQRVDDGYKGFPDIRENIPKLPSEYFKRFYYDTASSFTRSIFTCTYDFARPRKDRVWDRRSLRPESIDRDQDSSAGELGLSDEVHGENLQ